MYVIPFDQRRFKVAPKFLVQNKGSSRLFLEYKTLYLHDVFS